jgi:serine/threonine protein phosphatase PrpC/CRP-like cAMP-binding protein
MEVQFWADTDVGRARDHNEDNFLVDKKLNLFIVADGMGGHAAGEVASSIAVREVRRLVAENRKIVTSYARDESPEGRQAVLRLIEQATQAACQRIYELAQQGTERRGMGTTLSLLLIAGRRGFIGHVGDSRIYLLRTGQVHQLTEDHSLINELIKRGRLKPGDVFDSPYKNAVTRAVGVYESVQVDTLDFDILPGDNFVLCSDGLSCYLDTESTRRILESEDIKEVPERFIALANEAGGKDNITAVVVRILDEADEAKSERMTEVRLKLDTLRAIPLFKYLSYKGLVKVMNITETRRFRAGARIFEEGSRGDEFFILLGGNVRISKGGVTLAELGAGGHFGEMAMVDKSPRSATAVAVDDVKALVIQRRQFYDVMRRDPVMAVKLMWSFIQVLSTRLRLTNRELLSARETIDILRRHQVGGVLAEMPSIDPATAAVAALPIDITDELIPGFLFADSEASRTDPLLRIEERSSPMDHGDLDARPGLDEHGSVDDLDEAELPSLDDADEAVPAEEAPPLPRLRAPDEVIAGPATLVSSPPPVVAPPAEPAPTVTDMPALAGEGRTTLDLGRRGAPPRRPVHDPFAVPLDDPQDASLDGDDPSEDPDR